MVGQYQCKDCEPKGLAAYEIELQVGRLNGKRVVALKDEDTYVRSPGKTAELEKWDPLVPDLRASVTDSKEKMDSFVRNKMHNVLVLYYNKNCPTCQKLKPEVTEVRVCVLSRLGVVFDAGKCRWLVISHKKAMVISKSPVVLRSCGWMTL
jgi:hypothetical protein